MAHLPPLPPFNDPPPRLERSDSWRTIDPDSKKAYRPLEGFPFETPEQHNESEEAEFFKWWEEKCAQAYLDWTRNYEELCRQRLLETRPWAIHDQDFDNPAPHELPGDYQEYDLEEKYEFYVLFRTIRDPTWRDDVPPVHEDLRLAREASRVGLRGV